MKQSAIYLLIVVVGASLAGCFSSDTPQAGSEATKQFAGGPMPPDAQKKFQESMKKAQDKAAQNRPPQASTAGGNP